MKIFKYVFAAGLAIVVACYKNVTAVAEKKQPAVLTSDTLPKPLLVWSSAGRADSVNEPPAIFYAPHQDDETLGMGATIAELARSGKPVYVVLLTNGSNQNMLSYLQTRNASATMQDVEEARNNEFIAACKTLGATRIYISNDGKGFDENKPLAALTADFKSTMNYFTGLYPAASHKTISGNCDSYNAACEKMPAHQAAATALHQLYDAGKISDATLYRVYFYYGYSGICDHPCSREKTVDPLDKSKRQQAINEYKYVNEKEHRYGLGYWHSVNVLFDNSRDSNLEKVDSMGNDY